MHWVTIPLLTDVLTDAVKHLACNSLRIMFNVQVSYVNLIGVSRIVFVVDWHVVNLNSSVFLHNE